jgi:DNA-binding GntR family transcriptional regulator
MPTSLAFQAYEAIKKDILTCSLDPGQQIAQPQLVERYGLGLTPVREALKRLEHDGYVQSIPRFGYVISPITPTDVKELYELRLFLEIASVRLAAERAPEAELQALMEQANFTYRYGDHTSYAGFLEANLHFHTQIALASGNRRLAGLVRRTLGEMTRIFHLGLDLRDSAEEMRSEHVQLCQALLARDAQAAEQMIQEQISCSQERVLERLQQRIAQAELDRIPVQARRTFE